MNVILVEENVLILGNFPWEHAQESDVYYNEYIEWHRHHQLQRRFKLPSQWYKFSNRLMRLFRKMLGKEKLNIYFEYK
jgi:serine/threonine-protein kinase SBK